MAMIFQCFITIFMILPGNIRGIEAESSENYDILEASGCYYATTHQVSLKCASEKVVMITSAEIGISGCGTGNLPNNYQGRCVANVQDINTYYYKDLVTQCSGKDECTVQADRRDDLRKQCVGYYTDYLKIKYLCVLATSMHNMCDPHRQTFTLPHGVLQSTDFSSYPISTPNTCECELSTSSATASLRITIIELNLLLDGQSCKQDFLFELTRNGHEQISIQYACSYKVYKKIIDYKELFSQANLRLNTESTRYPQGRFAILYEGSDGSNVKVTCGKNLPISTTQAITVTTPSTAAATTTTTTTAATTTTTAAATTTTTAATTTTTTTTAATTTTTTTAATTTIATTHNVSLEPTNDKDIMLPSGSADRVKEDQAIIGGVGGSVAFIVLIAVVVLIIFKLRRKAKLNQGPNGVTNAGYQVNFNHEIITNQNADVQSIASGIYHYVDPAELDPTYNSSMYNGSLGRGKDYQHTYMIPNSDTNYTPLTESNTMENAIYSELDSTLNSLQNSIKDNNGMGSKPHFITNSTNSNSGGDNSIENANEENIYYSVADIVENTNSGATVINLTSDGQHMNQPTYFQVQNEAFPASQYEQENNTNENKYFTLETNENIAEENNQTHL